MELNIISKNIIFGKKKSTVPQVYLAILRTVCLVMWGKGVEVTKSATKINNLRKSNGVLLMEISAIRKIFRPPADNE